MHLCYVFKHNSSSSESDKPNPSLFFLFFFLSAKWRGKGELSIALYKFLGFEFIRVTAEDNDCSKGYVMLIYILFTLLVYLKHCGN